MKPSCMPMPPMYKSRPFLCDSGLALGPAIPPPMSCTTNDTMSRVTKTRASVDGEKIQTLRAGEKKFTMRAKICEGSVSMRCESAQRAGAERESDHVCVRIHPCEHVSQS